MLRAQNYEIEKALIPAHVMHVTTITTIDGDPPTYLDLFQQIFQGETWNLYNQVF